MSACEKVGDPEGEEGEGWEGEDFGQVAGQATGE